METTNNRNSHQVLKEWVELYGDDLLSWTVYKVGDQATAEDLVQEVFLAAFKSFESFKEKSTPKTWLFSILNHKIMDHHRKNFRELTMNQSQLSLGRENLNILNQFFDENGTWKPETGAKDWEDVNVHLLDDAQFNEVLTNCLKRLPENWFSAIQLKYLEEKNSTLICQDLGITPSNFWQILHRAKIQLRGCLEDNWFKDIE